MLDCNKLDYEKFPNRRSFRDAVLAAFGANIVDYLVATKDSPESSSTGYLYQVALRLTKQMRWKTAESYIFQN